MKLYTVTIWEAQSTAFCVRADSVEDARQLAIKDYESDGACLDMQFEGITVNVYDEETGLTYYEDGTIEG